MKTTQFASILFLSVSVICLGACGNKKQTKDNETHQHTDGEEHIYSCPMHPEVRGMEGDKCPKCNMLLEHMDELADNKKSYFMKLSSNPKECDAKQPVLLSFTPTEKGNETALVPLDIEHEKKLHLIIVSEDLGFFDHQHPEYQTSGCYDISYSFPLGGNYLLYTDYKPTGANHLNDKLPFTVKGETAKKTIFKDEKLQDTEGGFKVTIKPGAGKITTGGTTHLEVIIVKNGKEMDANNMESYLGAKAHVVMIGIENKDFLHVHPEVEKGRLDLHTSFEKPGLYRAWVQFQDEGKIIVADFVLNVLQGSSTEGGDHNMEEGHSH